jgi:predicted DNA-binding transcriptional regulator YafY
MPARLRHRVDALRVTRVAKSSWREGDIDAEHLLAIGTAVRAREVLRFDYAGRREIVEGADQQRPPRRAEPHHLVTWGGRWYLVGWDLDRVDWRTYRVDRMTPRTPNGPRFAPRELPAPDVAAFIAERFERQDLSPCRGTAILHVAAAAANEWIRGQAVVEDAGPDRCRVTAGSWSWAGLASWFAMFDADFELIGPPELRAAGEALARRFARATATDTGPAEGIDRPRST